MKEKDKLEIIKERFELEGMTGDQAEAARKAKLSPPNVTTGLARESWNKCTKSEKSVLIQLIKILDKRKEEEARLDAELIGSQSCLQN